MKAKVILVSLLLALCASVALAQGNNAGVPAPCPSDKNGLYTPRPVSRPSVPLIHMSRDDERDHDTVIPQLHQQLNRLMAAKKKFGKHHPSHGWMNARIAAINGKLADHEKRISWIEKNPLGGEKGQHAMWTEIHSAGIKPQSEIIRICDDRYVRRSSNMTRVNPAQAGNNQTTSQKSPVTSGTSQPVTPAQEGESSMSPIIGVLAVLLIAALGAIAIWITITVLHNRRIEGPHITGIRTADTLPNLPADVHQSGMQVEYTANGVYRREWNTD